MLLHGTLIFLALGYVICVVADKQKGILKTLGYTIGVATIIITFLIGIMASQDGCCPMMGKMSGKHWGAGMMKCGHGPMIKK